MVVIHKHMFIVSVVMFQCFGCSAGHVPIPSARLQLWLKADAGVTLKDSTVSRWADQSGNGNDALQQDVPRRPLLVKNGLNGKPVIRFDGFDDRLGLTGSTRMSQISLFIVLKVDSGAVGVIHPPVSLGDFDADGHVWGLVMQSKITGYSPDKMRIFAGSNSAVDAFLPGCCTTGQWHIFSVVTHDLMWNTTLRANGVGARMSHSGTNMFISVPLGNGSGTGHGGIGGADEVRLPIGPRAVAKCEIAEIILYTTSLSESARRSVEQYLGMKYHIPTNNGVPE
jgi:hypothetical protein